MAKRRNQTNADILHEFGVDPATVYNDPPPEDDPTPTNPVDVSDRPAEAPIEPAPSSSSKSLSLPDTDGFLHRETTLYSRALEIYEMALESSSEKTRLAAAKDIVNIYTRRREGPATTDKTTNNTQINITVDAVRDALDAAVYGLQGGLDEAQQRPAETPDTVSFPPVGPAPQGDDE